VRTAWRRLGLGCIQQHGASGRRHTTSEKYLARGQTSSLVAPARASIKKKRLYWSKNGPRVIGFVEGKMETYHFFGVLCSFKLCVFFCSLSPFGSISSFFRLRFFGG